MNGRQREEWMAAMRAHEREVLQLSQALAHAGSCPEAGPNVRQHVVYLTAQVMKHQISMALLAARLAGPAAVSH